MNRESKRVMDTFQDMQGVLNWQMSIMDQRQKDVERNQKNIESLLKLFKEYDKKY